MQQHATQAYQTVAKRTGNPRDLEANLLAKSAINLQRIKENWDLADAELAGALEIQPQALERVSELGDERGEPAAHARSARTSPISACSS